MPKLRPGRGNWLFLPLLTQVGLLEDWMFVFRVTEILEARGRLLRPASRTVQPGGRHMNTHEVLHPPKGDVRFHNDRIKEQQSGTFKHVHTWLRKLCRWPRISYFHSQKSAILPTLPPYLGTLLFQTSLPVRFIRSLPRPVAASPTTPKNAWSRPKSHSDSRAKSGNVEFPCISTYSQDASTHNAREVDFSSSSWRSPLHVRR